MAFNFESHEFKSAIKDLLDIARKVQNNPNSFSENVKLLVPYLNTVAQIFNPNVDLRKFDEIIVYTRNQPVSDFVHELKIKSDKYYESMAEEDLEELINLGLNLIYIYFAELKFRLGQLNSSIALGVDSFCEFVSEHFQDHSKYRRYQQFADRDVPFQLIQEIFHSNEIKQLADVKIKLETFQNIVDLWQTSFNEKEEKVLKLEEKLNEQKSNYDFVLLNEGFKNLHNQKKLDLKNPINSSRWFLGTILALPIIEILLFGILLSLEKAIDPITVWYVLIPSISLILFSFYFYRINLQEIRSIKSQMMQLELRMALCQFIHNYAEDSEKLHAKNKSGFEKFENIIFSPLVSSDDQIPNTFDGIEQLAKLVGEFRNK